MAEYLPSCEDLMNNIYKHNPYNEAINVVSCFISGSQLDELQKMNLVPQPWLLRVYAQHYHAVGDNRNLTL